MTIKLVAIDLDDTLLDPGLNISSRCLEAIQRAQEKGILVTLATGRMYSSALPYARLLQVDVPLITYQGALVKNSLSGEVLYNKPVPIELGVEVMEYFRQSEVHYHCYFGDQLCMEKLSEEGRQYAILAGVEPVIISSLIERARYEASYKILAVVEDEARIIDMEKHLKGLYGFTLNITRSKSHFLETMHPRATKGDALEVVASHYGIKQDEVMALGDSYNDLDMIEWAGLGVAMGNAREEVKQAADYITFSNDEEGVAEALHKFIL